MSIIALVLMVLVSSAHAGWQVTVADEFNGAALDTAKWATSFRWGGRTLPANAELECYTDNSVSLSGGRLLLRAAKAESYCEGGLHGYSSGMVSAHKSQAQLYGYFEMRARVPKGRGLWPAFWLLPANGGWPPEIDVMEVLGHDTSKVHMNVHALVKGVHEMSPSSFSWSWPDFSSDFHTFAVDWQPGLMIWYVDGVERKRLVSQTLVPNVPMYMIANLAVGGTWPGAPDGATPFPSTMEIDYIRAMKRVYEFYAPVTNKVLNPGFASGTTGYTLWGGAGTSSSYGGYSYILNQGGIEQVITGLKPYTRYNIEASLYYSGSGYISLGVRDFGGGFQQQAYHQTPAWTQVAQTFTTGNSTSARVFVYQTSGVGYADNISFVEAP